MDGYLWILILVIIGGILLFSAFIALMFRIANIMIKSNFDQRYDDKHTLKYFTVDDFENLKNEPLEFVSNEGQTLRGFLYSSTLVDEFKGLMIIAHGLGAGHLQYTTEINYFAQEGYLVFAFDDTGCNLSDGEKIKGVTQGLIDLDYALKYIDQNEKLKEMDKFIFGHSMGGYAACNITSLNKTKIKGIVALAPFKDEPSMLYEQFRAMTNLKYKLVYKLLVKKFRERFGSITDINTIDSLKKSDVPILIVAGDQDPIIDFYSNFLIFQDELKDRPNCHFLSVEERFHRPNLSKEAAKYDDDTNHELQSIHAEYKGETPQERIDQFYQSLDYNLLVQMDMNVMKQISDFFNSCK